MSVHQHNSKEVAVSPTIIVTLGVDRNNPSGRTSFLRFPTLAILGINVFVAAPHTANAQNPPRGNTTICIYIYIICIYIYILCPALKSIPLSTNRKMFNQRLEQMEGSF